MIPLHIGVDDTDSMRSGCTTYVAALLVERLSILGGCFLDYPNIIRLNPNVPWKTRGNAATCLRVNISEDIVDAVIDEVIEVIEEESDLNFPRTDPGIVFFSKKEIPSEIRDFARRTIQDVVKKSEALKLIKRFGAEAVGFKGGRGIIGALAAIGETLNEDHTYELIAYRTRGNRGSPRRVDAESVFQMDEETRGLTFNNIDHEKRRVLITPRGRDPVLLGIRGENPSAVKRACGMIKVNEEVERWVIFRTNQGTDAHLHREEGIDQIRPYRPVIVTGSLVEEPRMIPGRHMIFTIGNETGKIDCAAYEPTGKFRNIIKKLTIGDLVEVYGGIRPASPKNPMTINLEKIRILNLVPKTSLSNPSCKICGRHMESMGRNKGFRCKKCGNKERKAERMVVPVQRNLNEGLYLPPPRAHRHLTKPLSRYGLEKRSLENFVPTDFWGLGAPHFSTTYNST